MQASRAPPPASTPAQSFFASSAQALTFMALTSTSLHSSDRSAMCVLRQSLILPPPGWTPGHWALASLRQAPVNSTDDAIEAGSNNIAARQRELVKAKRAVM